ncbi:MAG TPA: RcpC/CpaB family pilus assembly protein [Elusimicrobiota bacterium]|nr:RcpC/CpaB family pilus assembly protein [Elusimicrobiota bacterium]
MNMRTAAAVLLLASFAAVPARSADSADPDVLQSGYRGMALSLPGDQASFVKKGDRVDVLVTFDAVTKTGKEKVTATILQNVLVLEAVKPAKIEERGVVELELNPNEAQYLALGIKQGEIQISVRAPGDKEMHPMEMASFRKLFQ